MIDIKEREAERDAAVAAIAEALDAIEREGREPDLWERIFLGESIGAVFRGLYHLALVGVDNAITPAEGRSPQARLPQEPFSRFDLALLRKALEAASREPVNSFGHFGPVILTGGQGS